MLQFKACVTVQGGCNLTFKLFYGHYPLVWPLKWKLLSSAFLWRWNYAVHCVPNEFLSVATQSEATAQYFPVVLFIFRYKVVPYFRSLSELLMCDHSVEELPRSLFCHTAWVPPFELVDKVLVWSLKHYYYVEFPFLSPGFSKKKFEFFHSVQVHGWSKGVWSWIAVYIRNSQLPIAHKHRWRKHWRRTTHLWVTDRPQVTLSL